MNQQGTIMETLGIETIHLSADRVVCTMPVDGRTRQPFGLLHGGASVVLAETAASLGTFANIDQEQEYAVGMEINANHLRSVADGQVTATAVPLHRGRTTMVWDIKITDDKDRLICVSRCTVAIRKKPS
ncbi:esterase [Insulibacter thermoxylanivorax]|uniref:Esterase n=1 Tax=Insulibacter thermoxylanivorax TaxID=2749268 RepID=A0A916QJ60_9BACL|nr:hotdog fold thioesterase [Insulibacter thermoxylanivorax]GFR39477.1 esterase [Insulibacter thermoxylanivorax]